MSPQSDSSRPSAMGHDASTAVQSSYNPATLLSPPSTKLSASRSPSDLWSRPYHPVNLDAMRNAGAPPRKPSGFGLSSSFASLKSRISKSSLTRSPSASVKDISASPRLDNGASPSTAQSQGIPRVPGPIPEVQPTAEPDLGKKRKRVAPAVVQSQDNALMVTEEEKIVDEYGHPSPGEADMASLAGMLWAMPSHYSPGTKEVSQSPLAQVVAFSPGSASLSPLNSSEATSYDFAKSHSVSTSAVESSISRRQSKPKSARPHAALPITGQSRSVQTLDVEAEETKVSSRGHARTGSGFYSSGSESEGEDEKIVSNPSVRSSQTSYGTLASTNEKSYDLARPQRKGTDETITPEAEAVLKPFKFPRSQSSPRSSVSHSSHASVASVGSVATGSSQTFASRAHSFSRPLRSGIVPLPASNAVDKAAATSSQSPVAGQAPEKPMSPLLDPIREDDTRFRGATTKDNTANNKFGSQPPTIPLPPIPLAPIPDATRSSSVVSRSATAPAEKAAPVERTVVTRQETVPQASRISSADRQSARPLSLAITKQSEAMITAQSAEAVILRILECLETLKDLFASACINRGFYRVFKKHEIWLMKNVVWNSSPAAWELREASPKEIIAALETSTYEYTPTRYLQFHTRDSYVLAALKSVILDRCQSYLRTETIFALREKDPVRSAELDDALWRIWTFCTIFGGERGKEDDIASQMDWLRGGSVARAGTRTPSIHSRDKAHSVTSRNHSMTSHSQQSLASHSQFCLSGTQSATSINTKGSEWFGRGNFGGLTAEELYDMTEMWNCIKALLHGISGPGRVAQARSYGVFDGLDIEEGDKVAEEAFLEEWVYYVTTLGLSAVVDLAPSSNSKTESVFITAKDMEWTAWKPSREGGSRVNFLREAVSRVYEEKMAEQGDSPTTQEVKAAAKAKRRSRGQELAAELREKKRSIDFKTVPISEDRPMSLWLEYMMRSDTSKGDVPPLPNIRPENAALKSSTSKSSQKSRQPIGTLSIFPPQYVRSPSSSVAPSPNTSAASSPRISRLEPISSSAVKVPILKEPELPSAKNRKVAQPFSPQLDVCHEATV